MFSIIFPSVLFSALVIVANYFIIICDCPRGFTVKFKRNLI